MKGGITNIEGLQLMITSRLVEIYGQDDGLKNSRVLVPAILGGFSGMLQKAKTGQRVSETYRTEDTMRFLKENNVRYDHIIFNAGEGERIMIDDMKPDGLVTAYAVNTQRDRFCRTEFITDNTMGTRFD